MSLKRSNWPRAVVTSSTSPVLKDNPLATRTCAKLHAGYTSIPRGRPRRRFPVLFDWPAHGSGPAHLAWRGFEENVPSGWRAWCTSSA